MDWERGKASWAPACIAVDFLTEWVGTRGLLGLPLRPAHYDGLYLQCVSWISSYISKLLCCLVFVNLPSHMGWWRAGSGRCCVCSKLLKLKDPVLKKPLIYDRPWAQHVSQRVILLLLYWIAANFAFCSWRDPLLGSYHWCLFKHPQRGDLEKELSVSWRNKRDLGKLFPNTFLLPLGSDLLVCTRSFPFKFDCDFSLSNQI